MAFEHGLDARTRMVPFRVRALVENLASQLFKLCPELRWVAHARHPVVQLVGQRIKLHLYLGTNVHPGGAPRSSATR